MGEVLQWPSVRLYSSLVWEVRVEESRVEREQDGLRSAERHSPWTGRSHRVKPEQRPTPPESPSTPSPSPISNVSLFTRAYVRD